MTNTTEKLFLDIIYMLRDQHKEVFNLWVKAESDDIYKYHAELDAIENLTHAIFDELNNIERKIEND